MQRVWITGGHGFVGRTLARELTGRALAVWTVERGPARPDDDDQTLRIPLAEDGVVARALTDIRPDAIVHLAAQSSGGASFRIPRETLRNNVESTLGLLEAILSLPAGERPRLLSVGSCEEYGAPNGDGELPLTEDQPLRPGNPYAVSKAAQTLLCQQYRRAHGLDVLAVRSFTHTGPGQSDRFVFGSWARQIAELERAGGGVLAVGNLDVSRDVSHVGDVARAYADLLTVDWPHDVVNLCRGEATALRTVLDHLCSVALAPVDWQVDPARLRPGDVPLFVGDPSRLRSMIGWIPSTPVETALNELLQWWRERIGDSPSSPTTSR